MPQETHNTIRDAQHGKGSIWRKEEVRPGGLEEGSKKESGPKRQTEGSRRGRTSAQAMHDAGSGGSGRVEEETITEINDAIRRSRESMPKESPLAGGIRKGYTIWVFAEEMTVIGSGRQWNKHRKQGHKGIEEGGQPEQDTNGVGGC